MRDLLVTGSASVSAAPANFRLKLEPESATVQAEPSHGLLSRIFSQLPLSWLLPAWASFGPAHPAKPCFCFAPLAHFLPVLTSLEVCPLWWVSALLACFLSLSWPVLAPTVSSEWVPFTNLLFLCVLTSPEAPLQLAFFSVLTSPRLLSYPL